MPRVEMPMASWESLLFMLSVIDTQYISPTAIDIILVSIMTIVTNMIFFVLLMAVLGSCVNLFDGGIM